MTTIQDRIIKEFKKQFTAIVSYEKWSDEDEATKLLEPQYLWNDLTKHNPKTVEQFLLTSIKEVEQETRKEIINEAVKIIESHIPTDNMGDYGGDGALSDNEIAEMFIDEIIPELEDLSITNKEKQNG